MNSDKKYWSFSFWLLLLAWIVGALLNMYRVKGGFFTNYLSDLAFPPWFYIYIRGLNKKQSTLPRLAIVGDWFGQKPTRAFVSIFLVGVFSEFKTLYWPGGIITGTFDPYDILAYFIGLFTCYILDRKENKLKLNAVKP